VATSETDLLLPMDPLSVRRARHHVSDTLRRAGREEWVDDAALAVTEIVSNVVLHACTGCEVSVQVRTASVRIAVRDFNPVLPLQQHFSQFATTGRGLSLVARLSAEFGVEPFGLDGKVVWFVIDGMSDDSSPEDPGLEWDLTGLLDDDADPVPLTAVLERVPIALWLAGIEHQTAVLRELYLVVHTPGQPLDTEGTLDLSAAGAALRLLSEGTDAALDQALGMPWLPRLTPLPDGHPSAMPQVPAVHDVRIAVGTNGAGAFGVLQDCLDHGQQLAMDGKLLVRPALEEVVALRDWACEQVIAQSTGVPPTPWDQTGFRVATSMPNTHRPPEWDDTAVRTSTRAVVAADDSNRLIAVSASAAALLGASVEQLVGKRITTIIPPRLREQHVVGFTRHLTTGQSRALGVEIDLPLLCLDGREVVRRFLIESRSAPAGRQVYVAWLDPLPEA